MTAYSTEPYSTEPYSSAATSTATTYSTEAYSTVAASAAAAYATESPAAGHFGGYINRSSDDDLLIRQDKLTDSERSIIGKKDYHYFDTLSLDFLSDFLPSS